MRDLEQAEKLTRIFGEWPSFHDAEVVRVVLDRTGPEAPTLTLEIHVYTMTSEVDARGFYVLTNHTLATLRFTEVALISMQGFNSQNSLSDLLISDLDPAVHEGRRVHVQLPSSYGLEAEFEAVRGMVVEAKPYDAAAA